MRISEPEKNDIKISRAVTLIFTHFDDDIFSQNAFIRLACSRIRRLVNIGSPFVQVSDACLFLNTVDHSVTAHIKDNPKLKLSNVLRMIFNRIKSWFKKK
jgi:hypothetical protein